jgi:hypothetical protein
MLEGATIAAMSQPGMSVSAAPDVPVTSLPVAESLQAEAAKPRSPRRESAAAA